MHSRWLDLKIFFNRGESFFDWWRSIKILHSGAFWMPRSQNVLQPRWRFLWWRLIKILHSGAFWIRRSQNFHQPRWRFLWWRPIKILHCGAFWMPRSQNFLQPRWRFLWWRPIKILYSGASGCLDLNFFSSLNSLIQSLFKSSTLSIPNFRIRFSIFWTIFFKLNMPN